MTHASPMIMIVEDDRTNSTFLADNLAADGFEPFTVESVEEALAAFSTRRPDLVLLDLGLPGRNGLDLVREVRDADGITSRLDPNLPLMVLSGRADDPITRVRVIDRGADDALCKPYEYAELLGLFLSRSSKFAGSRYSSPGRAFLPGQGVCRPAQIRLVTTAVGSSSAGAAKRRCRAARDGGLRLRRLADSRARQFPARVGIRQATSWTLLAWASASAWRPSMARLTMTANTMFISSWTWRLERNFRGAPLSL
ncbi:response regulator [Conexibacter sp. JD483]|uniref:response regulator transcription factor n=1 Tax=unclassified Conexibacter TaxID=2627773 RepID=UPI00272663F7|nr:MULTISPECIES: response regulator [unclassified Conexibacter]MDO8184698.1 response regulator [Conexibacter sp. CPCC 205706]MDO8198004.1 response regulator [Conexibacter sp. CPCC 205762]MDR9368434.1 response regulator [Conexibacter sp. JD483]